MSLNQNIRLKYNTSTWVHKNSEFSNRGIVILLLSCYIYLFLYDNQGENPKSTFSITDLSSI